MKSISLIFLSLLLSFTAFAGHSDKQKNSQRSLNGKVINDQGEEIAGVKITLKETNESVFADLDGKFNLKIKTDKDYTLLLEGIGYAPKQIKSSEISLFSEIQLKEIN